MAKRPSCRRPAFFKINGDNPLDATWIHPESYALAGRVLETVGGSVSDLADKEKAVASRAAHRWSWISRRWARNWAPER